MTKEEIIEIRKSLGITQEQFAALMGCSFTSVNRWEMGHASPSRLYEREIRTLARKNTSHREVK